MMVRVVLISLVSLLLTSMRSETASATEPETSGSGVEPFNLIFFGGEQPVRLELRVEIDGRPITSVWDETFTQLHSFLDRDGNKSLDRSEAARLPSEFAIRQILWGQFALNTGESLEFEAIDRDKNGNVTDQELADFYRRAGLGGPFIGIGRPNATDALTDALLKTLDSDHSGQVTDAEWLVAAESARKLDSNDDELNGPGELVAKTVYPGALGTILLKANSSRTTTADLANSLPFAVLPPRDRQSEWITALASSQQAATKQSSVSLDKLQKCLTSKPAATWYIGLNSSASDEVAIEAVEQQATKNHGLALSNERVWFHLRGDSGKLRDQTAIARKQFLGLFLEGDSNSDRSLDEQEIATPKAARLKQLASVADHDANGTLTQSEFEAWLKLHQQIAQGLILLTVLDHGPGLFEFLDMNHDGSLSARELRTAASRLKASGYLSESGFHREKLPRQLIATISHGHPKSIVAPPSHRGPAWFQAMDRNSDGDVSLKEWVGDLDVFRRLETDGDGFLTIDEAETAAKK